MAIFKRKAAKKDATEETQKLASAPAALAEAKPKKAAKKEVKEVAEEKKSARTSVSSMATNTLLSPLVTEKSAHLADQGVYVFHVPLFANRVAVRDAFRELYKVTPVKVNVVRIHGKVHRFGRSESRATDWKKALVFVPKGTRIDIFTL